jgi:glycosyltransferase involved in cell wall biosynthesis
MRILLFSQWFDPEPTFKGLVFARELVRQGYDVEFITGFPNYPGGKCYPGYKIKLIQRECIDKVNITRLPLFPSHNNSAIKRVINYVSFAFSALIYGLFIAKRADVMYAYHPPLTVGIAASLISWVRDIPLVYDVQDLWPDTLRATGMLRNKYALAFVGLVCKWVYKRVDYLVVLSPGLMRLLIQRGVPEAKVKMIYNWANEPELLAPLFNVSESFVGKGNFKVVFAGNMGKAQALDSVLDAAVILQERGSRAIFVMVGGGVEVERLKARAKEIRLENVVFMPPVPMSEVGAFLELADVLLVHLRKDPLFEITIPSKTQAYMLVGKPLLMAVRGDAADLVIRAKCGLIADPENPQQLADTVDALAELPVNALKDMGENGRNFYRKNLSLEVGVSEFASVFQLLSRKASRSEQ